MANHPIRDEEEVGRSDEDIVGDDEFEEEDELDEDVDDADDSPDL